MFCKNTEIYFRGFSHTSLSCKSSYCCIKTTGYNMHWASHVTVVAKGCRGDFCEKRPGAAPCQRQLVLQQKASSEKKGEKGDLHVAEQGFPAACGTVHGRAVGYFLTGTVTHRDPMLQQVFSWKADAHVKDPLYSKYLHWSPWRTPWWSRWIFPEGIATHAEDPDWGKAQVGKVAEWNSYGL